MQGAPATTVLLASAVPLALACVLLRKALAAAWDGPSGRWFRRSSWPARIAAVALACCTAKFGGALPKSQPASAVQPVAGAVATAQTEPAPAELSLESLADAPSATVAGTTPPPATSYASASLPAGYAGDPTDTDGDGIPDLWETWTRGNPLVPDSGLDRDGDGLTDLEEFQSQTDPRTADTDADGLDDAFEAANGMDPLAKASFVAVEPDANHDGVIDLWEHSGYLYGFLDEDGDGFEDSAEEFILPAASEENFDLRVDVRTSRSAVLTWSDETGWPGIVLPATPQGMSLRLRLPFGADAGLRLMPAPYNLPHPGTGELWRASLRTAFLPRPGQAPGGATCLVAADGSIVQRATLRESTVTRFPDGGTENWPGILVLERRFEVVPGESHYHSVGETVGPFIATNAVNIDTQALEWTADHGTMSPTNAPASTLTVTEHPADGRPVTVTARAKLDDAFFAEAEAKVWYCPRQPFSLDACTENFSPHLGETLDIEVTLPGCVHHREPGWLEAEVVRQTATDWEHVASVDMDPSTPATDRYGAATNLPHKAAFSWDGIAQASLPLADHPEDVFVGPVGSFHRAMPAIVAGEPVPPPFHTLRVRFWNEARTTVLAEEYRRFYVPQVVNLLPFGGESVFQEPVYSQDPDGTTQVLLYAGCASSEAEAALAQLPALAMAFFPPDVNLRIVTTNAVSGGHKAMVIVGETSQGSKRGDSPGFRKRNCDPYGEMAIYIASFQKSLEMNYEYMLGGYADTIPVPMAPEQFAKYIAPTVAHEVGHSVGLVDPDWIPATPMNRQAYHNATQTWTRMMDMGGLFYVVHRLNPHPTDYWQPDNLRYLRFVLPKGE